MSSQKDLSPLTLSDLPDRILIIPESLSSIDDFLFSGNPPPETLQLLLHPCQEMPGRTDHNFHRIDRNRLPDSWQTDIHIQNRNKDFPDFLPLNCLQDWKSQLSYILPAPTVFHCIFLYEGSAVHIWWTRQYLHKDHSQHVHDLSDTKSSPDFQFPMVQKIDFSDIPEGWHPHVFQWHNW